MSVNELLEVAKSRDYYFWLKSDLYKCNLVSIPKEFDPLAPKIDIFDREDIYPNCTVQVLTNSYTGKTSVGWWPNE